MTTNDTELIRMFIQESREHLDRLEPDLLSLETNSQDSELVNRIFRAVHSIKGSSGFFGLKKISQMSHAMESLMSRVREKTLAPNQQMVDMLLAGADKLRLMVEDVDHSNEVQIEQEVNALHAMLASATVMPQSALVAKALGAHVDRAVLDYGIRHGHHFYRVRLFTHKDIKDRHQTPLDYIKKIEKLGQFLDSYTDLDVIDGFENALTQDLVCVFLFSTVLEPDLMSIALEVPESQIEEVTIQELNKISGTTVVPPPAAPAVPVAPPAAAEVPAAEPVPAVAAYAPALPAETPAELALQKAGGRRSDDTIRVSVSLLDDLMNLAGEMVLGRNQLLRMAAAAAAQVSGMSSVLQNINLITSDMQEKVMRTRLQPVGSILSKFTRILRDMAHQLHKEIDLKISGEGVELDKSILEMLSDPLTHLIRNCADHGLEPPNEREQQGKPRMGTVRLTASHVGGQVHIEVTDDGRGLNATKIKRKALEKGLIKVADAEKMSERQIFNLIFLPGFSTADKVTDVSGRGVGMDVVRTNIEKLGGSVDLDSELGKGTRICLRLPLTLAIIPAMIVGMAGRRFAVPQVNLEEIVQLGGKHRVEMVRGATVLRLRGKLLPLVRLEEALGMTCPDVLPTKGYILVLKVDADRYGLLVHNLFDSEEIVVKPLSSYLKASKCYSGATIMGDGKVAMILDASGIAATAQLQFAETDEAAALEIQERAETQSLLIFRNAGNETFAINLVMVARIEKIRATDIQRVGRKEFLKYQKSTLRLLRLHDYMPVSRMETEPEFLYVIVPKLVHHPMGIIVREVVDAVHAPVTLEESDLTGPGVLGSAVLNNRMTIFVNVYSLFEAAAPELYCAVPAAGSRLNGRRILLAEDTAFFRTVVRKYLEEFGCHVISANNGMEAWEALNREAVDLLLTDIEMPGMNGFELTQRVRASEKLKHLPVVALTALMAGQYRERGQEAGINAYEVKLDKERLRATLEELLGGGPPRAQLPATVEERELVALDSVT